MQLGFCVTSDELGVQFRLLGQASLGRLLSFRRTAHGAAVIVGRLHYRDEVIAAIGGLADREHVKDDAGLILAAYDRWGWQGLTRLEGCFALALWDARNRRLYGRRDLLGGFPLYWGRRDQRMALATSLQAACQWVSADAPDEEYEAEYLMLPTCGEHELACSRTPYQGVQRLPPRTLLDAHLPAGPVRLVEHWDWLDRLEEPASDQLPALAGRYSDLLREAVRDRMVGRTAAHVSGGLDSTSVAFLALAEIERGAAQGPLHTISLVYDSMKVLSRERQIIEGAVSGDANAAPHFIAADGLLDFSTYATPPEHDEPWPWLSMAGTEMARVEVAWKAGADTVLTGQGADELLDMGPYHLTDLLRRRRLLRAWREASQAARAENCGVWPLLYPFGVRNLLPMGMRDGWGQFFRGGRSDWLHMGDFTLPPWIRPDYAKRRRLRERAMERAGRHLQPGRPTVLSVALAKIASRTGDLGVHARLAPQPRSTPKPILVEAMKGVLPDSIRLRNKAGFFNEPYFRGVARYAAELERLMDSKSLPIPDWLEPAALLHCLRQSALGIGNDRIQMDRLNVTLSWLRWRSLRQSRAARAVEESTVCHFRWAESGSPGRTALMSRK
jgi:asparagine synthase (glutamine-hydrolysing)